MFKLFKDSFKITNDCIILATPLVIFMSVIGWFIGYIINGADTIPKILLGGVTLLVMTSGFLASWLYMCKKTIYLSKKIIVFDKDRAKALRHLVLSLPRGIGRLFLPMLGVIGIYFILYGTLVFISCFLVNLIEPAFDFSVLGLHLDQLATSSEIINDVNDLPIEEFIPFIYWHFIMMVGGFIINYLTILWLPEIIYNEKNAFKALRNSIYKTFSNFKHSIILYLYISVLIAGIMLLNTILLFNPFLYFIVLILYYYLLVYIVVLIFTYYEQKYK